jgi:hypothetical protein
MAKRKPPPVAPVPGPAEYNRMATAPSWAAVRVLRVSEQPSALDKMDLLALIRLLRDQARAVNTGDLAQAEAMLINQATALQSLFARLVELGMSAEVLPQYEAHMRLALRAQAQCVNTLRVLNEYKNPQVVFAKQANIANQQQVNNGIPLPLRAREVENAPTQLSEGSHHELLPDPGASPLARRIDPPVATVEVLDRAEDARG